MPQEQLLTLRQDVMHDLGVAQHVNRLNRPKSPKQNPPQFLAGQALHFGSLGGSGMAKRSLLAVGWSSPELTLVHVAVGELAGALAVAQVRGPLPLVPVPAGEDAAAQTLPSARLPGAGVPVAVRAAASPCSLSRSCHNQQHVKKRCCHLAYADLLPRTGTQTFCADS